MPKPKKNESKQDYLKRCTAELIEQEDMNADQAYAVCNSYWDDAHATKAERQPITLTGTVDLLFDTEITAGNDPEQRVSGFQMTAYTGQVIDLGWFGRYVFDVSGMQAKAKIPILREHSRDRVVGWSRKAWADGKNFLISGEFSNSTRDAKEVLSLSREGYPWQCSVGIAPVKIKRLEDAKETLEVNGMTVAGPIEVWLQSKVVEVSFVSLGADDETAAIAMTDQTKTITCNLLHTEKEEVEMTLTEIREKLPELYQEIFNLGAASVDLSEARNDGITMERTRVTEILSAGADPESTHKAIVEGVSAEAAYKLFFEAEKAKKAAGLKEMADSAPRSLGYTEPKEPERIENANVELAISEKAIELATREKIDLGQATRRILSENKELAARYYKQFDA